MARTFSDEDFNALPGYTAAARRLANHPTFKAAWEALEVFPAQSAEEWLSEKLLRLRNARKDDSRFDDMALDVILAFGLLCVEADREKTRLDREAYSEQAG